MSDIGAHGQILANKGSLDPLMLRVGGARVVMLGAASHGTHDYHHWRAEITRRLVAEHGFSFVAVEGDWSDCDRVDASVRGGGADPRAALGAFERWPTWMWANEEVGDFLAWLRWWNGDHRVGFHGLDVYGLWESLHAILAYLGGHDPAAIPAASAAFDTFEPFHGYAGPLVPDSAGPEVVSLLAYLRRHAVEHAAERGRTEFSAWLGADIVPGAERYYRAMLAGDRSRDLRAAHMADTLDRLLDHYGPGSRGVVWAHNSHVGDARATDTGVASLGELARRRHGADAVVLVGFGCHRGDVLAAPRWGSAAQVMTVPPARAGSVEDLLHGSAPERALFVFPRVDQPRWLTDAHDHRGIGVVRDPGGADYVTGRLGQWYDAFCWFNHTTPVHTVTREREIYPSGV
ncbi:erythromycin esterase family protein [Longispora sp. K20-0274]|uniref:erythromycin esterase family protein n=1 Tax=Longispora sp. K20-0274 TaxID=3088255 RepID=UPI0039999453